MLDNPMPDLPNLARPSIKDLTLKQLKRYIVSGVVQPGQRLPPERELAERLGVGRSSIREALKVLEAVGLIEARVGEGTFISEQAGASLGRTIGLSLAVWGGSIIEILGARQVFEVEAAGMAAAHADEQDLQSLGAELQKMDAGKDGFHMYLAADMQFHRLVARATHNTIVATTIANLIDVLEQVLYEAQVDNLPTQDEGRGTHQEVFAAIERHDQQAASDAMRRHLASATELWQAVVSLGGAID